MLDTTLTKEYADKIYNSSKQVVEDLVSWRNISGKTQKIFIDVITDDGLELEVRGSYSWSSPKKRYSFALLYKKCIPIRRWDDRIGHIDRCSKLVMKGPHKHYYRPGFADTCSYETSDIRAGDVNGALMDFLAECNISMVNTKYQRTV
jgi:hypothetical protein